MVELNNLIIERANMDMFFTSFLEKNKTKMTEENHDEDTWESYKKEFEKYATLESKIRMLTYYGKRQSGDNV